MVGSGFETIPLLEQDIRQLLQQLELKLDVISEVRTSNLILKAQKNKFMQPWSPPVICPVSVSVEYIDRKSLIKCSDLWMKASSKKFLK